MCRQCKVRNKSGFFLFLLESQQQLGNSGNKSLFNKKFYDFIFQLRFKAK